jgi:hypothetical protein
LLSGVCEDLRRGEAVFERFAEVEADYRKEAQREQKR